jgi:hypothetical protein
MEGRRCPIMDRVIKGILIILWLALLTSGCVTTRMYEGEQLPNEQIAIIKGSLKYYVYAHLEVYLKEVDGIQCRGVGVLTSSVEVLPGRHEIIVGVKRRIGGGNAFDLAIQDLTTPHDYYALSFYAMPGHKYKAKSSFWKTKNGLVTVVDTHSGEIMASQPRKRFQPSYISGNWGWHKPDVGIEQLNQDYSECRAKGQEKSCMEEKGYTWAKF